jgi:hypothetical protein
LLDLSNRPLPFWSSWTSQHPACFVQKNGYVSVLARTVWILSVLAPAPKHRAVLFNCLAIHKPELNTVFRSILDRYAPPFFKTWLSTPEVPKQCGINIVGTVDLNFEVWVLPAPCVTSSIGSGFARAHKLLHNCTK